jgi:histidine triad (HIT) family protein
MIPSNAPEGYKCPICLGIQGSDSPDTLIKSTDFVYDDNLVTAFVNTFFMGKNAGHVIVVPKQHFESVYTLPSEIGHRVFDVSKKIALAMKGAYKCNGITMRQNNDPSGDQHAFHYHLHVFPRYKDDEYNSVLPSDKRLAEPEERSGYAEKIKAVL